MSEGAKGFLSHSETDAAAVRRLRLRLQKYALPAALRGGKRRLGRFIADVDAVRSEDELKQELAAAEWLIVCCSPASFASERVNNEIDTFIRVNANARFLMVLLDGDPLQALPPRLRAREPLTADFRPEADGVELGFLKLVAALSGLDLGALRDQQAAGERARAGAGAALAAGLALLAGAGATVSVHAMRERDRAEAMAHAAIDIAADLAVEAGDPARSEQQFERLFADGPSNPQFARQRAHLLLQLAELYQRRGEPAASRERALAAVAAFEGLPAEARRGLDFTRALSVLSQAEAQAGREAEALAYATRAVAAARDTVQAGDGAVERAAFAAALGRLGELHMRAGRPAEALPFFAEAIPALEAVRTALPEDETATSNLIAALEWLGDAQATTRDWTGARASFARSVELTRAQLERAPRDPVVNAALGSSLLKLGRAAVESGDDEAARGPLEESLAIARAQAATHPDDDALARQASARLILTAQVQARLGRVSNETLEEAIIAARLQAQRDPGAAAKTALADLLAAKATRLRRAGDFTAARTAWRDAAEVLRELRASEPGATAALAIALENIGEASVRLGDSPGALAAYGDAVRVRRAALTAAPQDRTTRAALAQTLHTLALTRERADNAAGARAAFDEAARLRVALAEEDHADEAIAALAVESLRRLAQAQQGAGNEQAARRSLETARDILARLAQANPEDSRRAAALRRAEAALQAAGGGASN